MKHKGVTPAIYATSRKAFLVQYGQTIPARSRLVISHADITVLAMALARTTNVAPDGTRVPALAGHSRYYDNVELALRYAVCTLRYRVSIEEFRTLRHTLGASHISATEPDLGWRNYYCTYDEPDATLAALIERGFMVPAGKGYYRATARGRVIAGAPPAPTEGAAS